MYGGELTAKKKKLMIVSALSLILIVVMILVWFFFLKSDKCKDGYTYRESDKKCVGWLKKPNSSYTAKGQEKSLEYYGDGIKLDACLSKCNDYGCDMYSYTIDNSDSARNFCIVAKSNGVKYDLLTDTAPSSNETIDSYLLDIIDPL